MPCICGAVFLKAYFASWREQRLQRQMEQIRRQLLEADARTLVQAMKQMGVTRVEAVALITDLWKGEEEV